MAALLLVAQAQGQVAFRTTAAGIPVNGVTQYGNLTGRYSRRDNVNRFYGIPVAAPTGGNNRFKEPISPTSWTTIDASVTRSCFYFVGSFVGFEDCLSVDVVAPNSQLANPGYPLMDASGTYPVHVWFHGGGFEIEETAFWQGNDAIYAGASYSHLPNSGKVVAAFPKYRLSILGAMSHPALRNGIGGNTYSGSWMVYDALNALRWIQTNIGNFGGNSGRVTISGQSAGATLSGCLTASPLTYAGDYATGGPLITGAVMHSMWQTAGYGATYSQLMRDQASSSSIVDTGCSTSYDTLGASTNDLTSIASCLRSGSLAATEATQLYSAESVSPTIAYIQISAFGTASRSAFDGVYGANTWGVVSTQSLLVYPVVDGRAYTASPLNSWIAGNGASVSIMLGHTIDDDGPFWTAAPGFDLTTASGLQGFLLNVGFLWGIFSNPAMNETIGIADCTAITLSMPTAPIFTFGAYSSMVNPYQQQVAIATDGFFAVNHATFFDTLSAQTARTPGSLFMFKYAEPAPAGSSATWQGAVHMIDLTYMWGLYLFGKSVNADNYAPVPGLFTYTAGQLALGATMNTFWSNFFVTGAPNLVGDGLPTWSPITTTEKHTMIFQSSVPFGAILDPCAMFTGCNVEPTADFRRTTVSFWQAGFVGTAASATQPTCSPVVVGPTHTGSYTLTSGCGITVTPPAAAVTLGGACLTSSVCATGLSCKCVASTSGRRSLLFGMPSSGASTECYCL